MKEERKPLCLKVQGIVGSLFADDYRKQIEADALVASALDKAEETEVNEIAMHVSDEASPVFLLKLAQEIATGTRMTAAEDE